jgi:pimeloyl-ACP methyl ester carboxylesterase
MMKIAIADNCQLAYDEYDFTPPRTNAEPVVLVHGFTKNRRFWFEWIPHVAQAFHAICVDQRGHGDSDALPSDFGMSIRAFSDDLAAFVRKVGLTSAHFVMAEFSSPIALDFAVAYQLEARGRIPMNTQWITRIAMLAWSTAGIGLAPGHACAQSYPN